MYSVFGVLLFTVFAFLSYYFRGLCEAETELRTFWSVLTFLFAITAVTYAVVAFFVNLYAIGEQRFAFEHVRQYLKNMNILKSKQEVLKPIFINLLADKYPAFEEKIFGVLAQNEAGLQAKAADFPELKSVDGYKVLIELLSKLFGDYYLQQLEVAGWMRIIRQRAVNPFLITFLLPPMPDDLVGIEEKLNPSEKK